MKNYHKEFSNCLSIMGEALKRDDFAVYDAAKDMLDDIISESRERKSLLDEMNTSNFGVLNHIFEEALPTLIKSNKKAVRNVLKLMKEDRNLREEFKFYRLLKEYNEKVGGSVSADDVLKKIVEVAGKNIDKNTLLESNKKLRDTMKNSGIIPMSHIDESDMKLYKNVNNILLKEQNLSNFYNLQESYDFVGKYMKEHNGSAIKESVDVDKMINDFEDKIKTNLNESEISFVQEIMDFKSPIAKKRKEKLFNSLKEDCLKKVDEMLKNDSENEELKNLKEQLNSKAFSNENIVKDIAKLLEIRDILMDD